MPYLEIGRDRKIPSDSDLTTGPLISEHIISGLTNDETPFSSQNEDGAIVFSVDNFSIPPETTNPSDTYNIRDSDNPDVVMVVPTAVDPAKEVTVGIIFLIVSLVFMLVFVFFVYVGYKQYKTLLNTKNNDLQDVECSGDDTLTEKSGSDSKIEYKNFLMSPIENRYSDGSGNNLLEPKLSMISRHIGNNKIREPRVSRVRQSHFKPQKLTSRLHKIGENSEAFLLDELSRPKQELDTSMGHESPYSFESHNQKKSHEDLEKNKTENKVEKKAVNQLEKGIEKMSEKGVEKKILSSRVSQMLNKYRKESQGLSAFINDVEKEIPQPAEFLEVNKKKDEKKVIYSIKELVELEPVDVYQLFEYSYNDGDLLVTDLIFPSVPVIRNNLSMSEVEKMLTSIRIALMSRKTDSVTKIMELFIFVTFSFGIKTYENPNVFTLPYGILVDTMIQFDLVSQIPEHLSLVMQSGYVETIILYCINCWKFDKVRNEKIQQYFEVWNTKPYIPTKLKLYKFIVTLLLQGYRSSLLKEVLVFFSIPPSPHLLQNIITEALKSETTPDVLELLQYLRRQLQEEHYNCCSNTEKWRHWEFTTPGVKNSASMKEQDKSLMYKIPGTKYESTANAIFSNEENIIRQPQKEESIFMNSDCNNLNNVNSFSGSKENCLFIDENTSKISLQPDSTKMFFSSSELPGSLIASPVHSSPKNV